MEQKKVYGVMWFVDCRPNGSRSYSREYDDLEDMRNKFNEVLAKPNCYAATAMLKVRTYDDDSRHIRTSCTILDRVDKY